MLFTEFEQLLIRKTESAIQEGRQLEQWYRQSESRLAFFPLQLKGKYRLPNRAEGFFDTVSINGLPRSVMGCRQEVEFSRLPGKDGERMLREFVLGNFQRLGNWKYDDGALGGFTFEKTLHQAAGGGIERFAEADRLGPADWRDLGEKYGWILLTVHIHDFVMKMGPIVRRIPESAYVVPHPDFLHIVENPSEDCASVVILYDNTKLAVVKILGDGTRRKTQAFSELQSHYLFQERFGRPGKGNDKGKVEGLVGYARRNFMVPVPRCASWGELNARLLGQCQKRRQQRLRRHEQTIGERFEKDRTAMLPLPAAPYEACDKRSGRVSSLSLVRYRGNDYSVPVCWGHRPVLVKGYVHEVVISCGAEVIARHVRSYEREDLIFDPLHYLALLEQKINALDQAAPLAGWELPEPFAELRRLLEARLSKRGQREYVQVLRLLETFSMAEVTRAVEDALRMRAISCDAVKHLLLCRIEQRPPRLDLENYPHLPMAQVATTAASDYLALLTPGQEAGC